MYTAIIRPTITYTAVMWWSKLEQKTTSKKLKHIQRLAFLYITDVTKTALTTALEIIIELVPLPVYVKQKAMVSYSLPTA